MPQTQSTPTPAFPKQMIPRPLRVVRSDYWIDPAFDRQFRDRPGVTLDVFAARGADEAGWAHARAAHVYHVSAAKDELPRQWFVDAALLQRCPDLLCVSSTGRATTPSMSSLHPAGVAVVNQAGGNAVSVAEHTFGLMLGVSHRMLECDRKLRREQGFTRQDVMGHEIRGKTLGLVGIGNVGTRVAALAHAFGMDVLATDPLLERAEIERRGAAAGGAGRTAGPLGFRLAALPARPEHPEDDRRAAFGRMKPGAIFITTARGGIHDEAALMAALQSGHLAGAGIDVWDQEPPPLDHPLLAMDNVFATFHTAGVTHEARRNMATHRRRTDPAGAGRPAAAAAGQPSGLAGFLRRVVANRNASGPLATVRATA